MFIAILILGLILLMEFSAYIVAKIKILSISFFNLIF